MGKTPQHWSMMWNLPRLVRTSWRLFQSSRVPLLRKVFVIVVGLGYFLWPLDLIPDFIPFLGEVDDLTVIFFLLNWFINTSGSSDDLVSKE